MSFAELRVKQTIFTNRPEKTQKPEKDTKYYDILYHVLKKKQSIFWITMNPPLSNKRKENEMYFHQQSTNKNKEQEENK